MTIYSGKLHQAPSCPTCQKILDGFTIPNEDIRPNPGDISVCCYCGDILQFTDDLMLITADADNLVQVDFIQLQRINAVVAALRKKRANQDAHPVDSFKKSV